MKKLLKTIKHWLIKKLGGYTDLEQTHSVKIIRESVPAVTIGVETFCNPTLLEKDPLYKEEILRELAHQLVGRILTNRLFILESSEDSLNDRMRVKMRIILPKDEGDANILF